VAGEERLFASSPPRLVDYLPGAANQLKERLGPDRPPLVRLEAARCTLVAGTAFPLRREFRAFHPAATPARTLGRRVAARLRPPTRRERPRVRRLEIQPGPPTLPVATLELDTPVRRFLAVAGGHASPEAMARRWAKGDSWWWVGDGPEAFVRLGAGGRAGRRPLREAVLLDTGALTVEALVDALAAEVKAAVFADLPADARSAGAVPGRPAARPTCTVRCCHGRAGARGIRRSASRLRRWPPWPDARDPATARPSWTTIPAWSSRHRPAAAASPRRAEISLAPGCRVARGSHTPGLPQIRA
jgi:hypothetical protein